MTRENSIGEQYLVWLKRHIERKHGTNIVNLATSGVQQGDAARWIQHVCINRTADLADGMAQLNEFGLPSLKDAIRAAYGIAPECEVVLTSGASGGMRLVYEMLLAGMRDAEVIVEAPAYEPLTSLPARLGAHVVSVRREYRGAEEFIGAIEHSLTDTTRAVVVSNVHNPTGDWLTRESIARLAQAVEARAPECALVVDEAFGDLGPCPGTTVAGIAPCVISVNSLTKAYGLGGLRCGWVAGDRSRFPTLVDDWVLFENIGAKLMEVLAAIAFDDLPRLRRDGMEHLSANRQIVSSWLDEMRASRLLDGQFSPYGCLLFPRLGGELVADAVVDRLEHEYGVLVGPGRFFGDAFRDHIRIGFGGNRDQITEGLKRIAAGLRSISAS